MSPQISQTPKDLEVLIIGTGITGLLIAQGLKQAGIRATIFEKDPSHHQATRDWTLAIHWSAPLLKKLLPPPLHARLREAYTDPFHPYNQPTEKTSIYNSKTGELLRDVAMPGMIRVDRNRMRQLCGEGIEIKYRKVFTELKYGADGKGVTVHFADGTAVEGDIVIGADGPRSAVREQLLGKEKASPTPLGLDSMMTSVNYVDAETALLVRGADSLFSMGYNPAGIMNFIGLQNVLDPNDPKTWTFSISTSWPRTGDDYPDSKSRLAAMRKSAEHCVEPFRSSIMCIPDETPITINRIQYWVTSPWDNHGGRVTLAGDAAHAMTPYRGQGLNHCICDVVKLVNALVGVRETMQLADAISEYEAEMIPRCKAEVESSKENALMVHDWERLRESAIMTVGAAKTS